MKKEKILVIVILLAIVAIITLTASISEEQEELSAANTVAINTVSLEGEYNIKAETEYDYTEGSVIISNVTSYILDFKIYRMHGADIERVNLGELEGQAIKVGPNKYEFNENDNIITFEFDNNILVINESYKDGYNPYAGNNVYFAGNYSKLG